MSKVVLVANADKVYAVPTEVCEKYELSGEELEAAQEALSPDDVEGQMAPNSSVGGPGAGFYISANSRGEAYELTDSGWVRAPWYD